MKISANLKNAFISGLLIFIVLLIELFDKPDHAAAKTNRPENTQNQLASSTVMTVGASVARNGPAVAPFIVKDTDNDSPGTNIVTRIVTFSAAIGGTPAPVLQWKVNHGDGFESLAGATNAMFRIGNAQVSDSGFYSLFATNSVGGVSTTPQQLIITEGQD